METPAVGADVASAPALAILTADGRVLESGRVGMSRGELSMIAVMTRTTRTTTQQRILYLRVAGLCLGLIAITSFLGGAIPALGGEPARPWTLVGYPALFGCLACLHLMRRLVYRRDGGSSQHG